jgi:hypothetical protein
VHRVVALDAQLWRGRRGLAPVPARDHGDDDHRSGYPDPRVDEGAGDDDERPDDAHDEEPKSLGLAAERIAHLSGQRM